jgi:trk system potassium uptake protein
MIRERPWVSRLTRILHRDRRFFPTAGKATDVRRRRYTRPALAVVAGFAAVILLGALVLMLPVMQSGEEPTSFVEALFTATSAVCVVGLVVVDTGTHWSFAGQIFILFLIQIGGLGIMTLTALLAVLIIGRFGLRVQMSLQAETRTYQVTDARGIALRIVKYSLFFEALIALVLCARLWLHYREPFAEGLWIGVFHAISSFNNAGFSLFSDGLTQYNHDVWMLAPAMLGVIIGGIGFPVLLELRRQFRNPRHWTLHTRLTIWTTVVLLLGGTGAIASMEWHNPATLASMEWPQKLLNSAFHGVMPRSGGLNSIDTGAMYDSSLFATMMLMFVGGGSGGTAGGIKVTTLAVLMVVVWTEMRGHPAPHAAGRRLTPDVVRQSLALTFLSMTMVAFLSIHLLATTHFPMNQVLFEAVSAVGVVGLSTGITGDLHPVAQAVMVPAMLAGRLGPITFASALALRDRTRRYDLPEGRPIIG